MKSKSNNPGGRPKRLPETQTVAVNLLAAQVAALDALADRMDTSRSEQVRRAVGAWIGGEDREGRA